MDDELHPVVRAFVAIAAVAVGLFSLWCTVIAFVGGTIPLFGWEMDGGIGTGLLWLFIIDPIVITLGYWAAMLIALPLGAIFRSDR